MGVIRPERLQRYDNTLNAQSVPNNTATIPLVVPPVPLFTPPSITRTREDRQLVTEVQEEPRRHLEIHLVKCKNTLVILE